MMMMMMMIVAVKSPLFKTNLESTINRFAEDEYDLNNF